MASYESDRQAIAGRWHQQLLSVVVIALVSLTGCVPMDSFVRGPEAAPVGVPCQVMATWNREVLFVPDPAHMGQPGPGLAGRVYLFGAKVDYPMAADGNLVVDLFNDKVPTPPGTTQMPLEEWRFDKDTLKRLLRKDPIGWGYTVFLPWGTYRPDISHVHLRVRFEPINGSPLYSEGAPLTLYHEQK